MFNRCKRLSTISGLLLFMVNIPAGFAADAQLQNAQPQPLLERNKFSVGWGLSNNSASGLSDEIGFQFFGAYDLNQINLMEGVKSSVEFGFMDYGFKRNSTGIWGTYVIAGSLGNNFGWLARLGVDVGDDSGLMIGVGAGYDFARDMEGRIEYVVRDEIDSLQFNFLYRL